MKKISKKTRWRLIRLLRILKRKQKKKSIRKRKNKGGNKTVFQNDPSTRRIYAPKEFNIFDKKKRRYVTEFLGGLRRIFAQKDVKNIVINFRDTVKFDAGATLLFYAELSHLIEMRDGGIAIDYKAPINIKASEVLRQIGFYRICGKNPQKRSNQDYDDVVHWRVARGSLVDNTLCAPVIEEYEGQLAEPLINGLFRGLGEAMTNTIHHAYIDIREDGLNYRPPTNNWWMFSQVRNNCLNVVFCDLGIGISRTLPIKKPNLFKKLVSLKSENKDSEHIRIAIEDGLSRTNELGRGKGLGDIVDFVTKQRAGDVTIFSNRGKFFKSRTQTIAHVQKESILGTLILWQVPLSN